MMATLTRFAQPVFSLGMRVRCLVFLVVVMLIGQGESSIAVADHQNELVHAAMAKVASSLVRIRTIGDSTGEDLAVSSQTTTGIAISPDGYILTSSFGFRGRPAAVVVEDGAENRVAAKVVATDHLRKLVLLRCPAGSFPNLATLETATRPPVGATAIALGKFYPGAMPSVSVGIVSALHRIYGLAVQTDAKISPVNYGGPLIDLNGKIIGLLVPLSPQDVDGISAGVEWYDSGIGFCIPWQDALRSADRLRAGKDLVRGRMGVGLSTKNPLASEFSVISVLPNSPADQAGLQKNDVIRMANGRPIERLSHFEAVVKSRYAGETLKLVVERNDQTLDIELSLAEKLKAPKRGYAGVIPFTTFENRTGEADNDENEADMEREPAIFVHVLPGSPADKAGIPDAAQILVWNKEQLTSLNEFSKRLGLTYVGQSISVEFQTATTDKVQTRTVEASESPSSIFPVSPQLREQVLGVPSSAGTEWSRREHVLEGDIGKVWLYAPQTPVDGKSGIVVLLSQSMTPAEIVLKKWSSVCEKHNLVLAVPSPDDGATLSREHTSVVRAALSVAVKGRAVDVERIVLVAENRQAELCGDVLFNPRAASVSAAVFVDCWPRVAGVSQALVAQKPLSVFMQRGNVQPRQAIALQRRAVSELIDVGVKLTQSDLNDRRFKSAEQQIGLWAFALKVR